LLSSSDPICSQIIEIAEQIAYVVVFIPIAKMIGCRGLFQTCSTHTDNYPTAASAVAADMGRRPGSRIGCHLEPFELEFRMQEVQ